MNCSTPGQQIVKTVSGLKTPRKKYRMLAYDDDDDDDDDDE